MVGMRTASCLRSDGRFLESAPPPLQTSREHPPSVLCSPEPLGTLCSVAGGEDYPCWSLPQKLARSLFAVSAQVWTSSPRPRTPGRCSVRPWRTSGEGAAPISPLVNSPSPLRVLSPSPGMPFLVLIRRRIRCGIRCRFCKTVCVRVSACPRVVLGAGFAPPSPPSFAQPAGGRPRVTRACPTRRGGV